MACIWRISHKAISQESVWRTTVKHTCNQSARDEWFCFIINIIHYICYSSEFTFYLCLTLSPCITIFFYVKWDSKTKVSCLSLLALGPNLKDRISIHVFSAFFNERHHTGICIILNDLFLDAHFFFVEAMIFFFILSYLIWFIVIFTLKESHMGWWLGIHSGMDNIPRSTF